MRATIKGKVLAVVPQKTKSEKQYLMLQIVQNGGQSVELTNVKYWGTKQVGDFKVNSELELPVSIKAYSGKNGAGLDVSAF